MNEREIDAASRLEAEVLRHALRIAAEEASIVVVKSAHSAMIVEGADACAGILDATGRLVSLSTATNLMHASSLRCSLPAVLADHPLETMRDGDVFVMNDCFRGGIHANDLLVFRPVFIAGRVRFFTGTLIHVSDLGGSSAGGIVPGATDVFAEGLQLPPVKLYAEGREVADLHNLIALNSRTPDRVMGDLKALVAGAHVAARRLEALAGEYGPAALDRGVANYIAGTERRMRDELGALTPGVYRGEYAIDDDGLDLDRSPVVRVEVTVGGPGAPVRLDFSATDDQARGAINAGFSQALTGATYAVRCYVDPSIPMNEGCYAPIEVVFRKGSLLDPKWPAACGGRVVSVTAVCEAVVDALSQARPDRATAASAVIHPFTLAAATGGNPWLLLSYEYGGLGARASSDGPSATGSFFLGGRNVVPQVEPLEARLPLVFESQSMIPDSGGPGRYRGGLGVETRIRVLKDCEVAIRSERVRFAPRGRDGGRPGRSGEQFAVLPDGGTRPLLPKAANQLMYAGETFVLRTSGGGGLGRPEERDAAQIEADLVEGWVSPEAARRDYGFTGVKASPSAKPSGAAAGREVGR
ncbi:MAG: hydantoinase B/oxoprolinase family protein [Deltaproteobacteria bacterium]|nr:hydantoinase B/oxoprolinase family protein [Deltaproteobacteria bacterium]